MTLTALMIPRPSLKTKWPTRFLVFMVVLFMIVDPEIIFCVTCAWKPFTTSSSVRIPNPIPNPDSFPQLFNWASNLLLRFEHLGDPHFSIFLFQDTLFLWILERWPPSGSEGNCLEKQCTRASNRVASTSIATSQEEIAQGLPWVTLLQLSGGGASQRCT